MKGENKLSQHTVREYLSLMRELYTVLVAHLSSNRRVKLLDGHAIGIAFLLDPIVFLDNEMLVGEIVVPRRIHS